MKTRSKPFQIHISREKSRYIRQMSIMHKFINKYPGSTHTRYSPSVLTGSNDGRIGVVSETMEVVGHCCTKNSSFITCLTESGNKCKRIISGDSRGYIKVWGIIRGKSPMEYIKSIRLEERGIICMCRMGESVIASTRGRELKIVNILRGECIHSITTRSCITCMLYDEREKSIVIGGGEGFLDLWDTQLSANKSSTYVSPNLLTILIHYNILFICHQLFIYIYDTHMHELTYLRTNQTTKSATFLLLRVGAKYIHSYISSQPKGKKLGKINPNAYSNSKSKKENKKSVVNNEVIVIGGKSGCLDLLNVNNQELLGSFPIHNGEISAIGELKHPRDSPFIVTVSHDRSLRILDLLASNSKLITPNIHISKINTLLCITYNYYYILK